MTASPRLEKLRVAVDVDGVLAETMEAWCKTFNERYGRHITIRDLDTWGSWKKLGIPQNEFYRILDGTWDDWPSVPPTEPDLAEKVQAAERYGHLDIVTGRSIRTVDAVKKWLEHQKIPFNNFVRVHGWRWKIGLDYDVFIDDAPELMPLISKNPSLIGILYSRPWNMNVPELPRIFRVKSWTQIPDVLDSIRADLIVKPKQIETT